MRKKFLTAVAVAGLGVVSFSGAVNAEKPANPGEGGRCVAAGLKTLNSLGLTSEVARNGLPAELGFGNLSLKDTIAAHRSAPSLFTWCNPES